MADQSNPWGTTEAADSAAQSADAWGSTPAPPMAAARQTG
jgi:glycine betaine/proline transport system permease protein